VPGYLLVRGAKQLLTLHGRGTPRRGVAMRDIGLITDGAVLAKDGVIVEVGPSRRVENLAGARAATEVDATGRVVLPGLVDSHTHLIHGGPWLAHFENRLAGCPQDPARGFRTAAQALRTVSARRLELRAGAVVHTMARHGTTTIEAKSGFGGDQTGEMKILRVLSKLHGKPLDVVSTVAVAPPSLAAADLQRTAAPWLAKVARRRLAAFADIFPLEWRYPTADLAAALRLARALGFQLRMHEHPALGVELGAVSVDLAGACGDAEVRLLAASETIATVLPGAAFHLHTHQYPPARALVDTGAAVALASDFNPEGSPVYSLQGAVGLACVRLGLLPSEAIAAATINAAHALRMGDRVGSIEPGKQADLIVLNASDYREMGYWYGINLVHTTIKKGVVIASQ